MGRVHAVLLVPAEGDALGLLREGPCGARPPMAWQCTCREVGPRPWLPCRTGKYRCAACGCIGYPGKALVLAWDGEPVAEGCDHAQERVIHGGDPLNYMQVHRHWFRACVCSLLNPEPLLKEYAVQIRNDPRWTLILLDADSREIGGDDE